MTSAFTCLEAETLGEAVIVGFREGGLEEPRVFELGKELASVIKESNCQNVILRFNPDSCLYSAVIAELLSLRRRMLERKGRLKLCSVPAATREVLRVSGLEGLFEFAPDVESALKDQ